MKNIFFFVLSILLLLSISACSGKKDATKSIEGIMTGTEGLSVSFLPNNPPAKVIVEEGIGSDKNNFDVVLDLRNKGAHPELGGVESGLNGRVYLSGFDPDIVVFDSEPVISLHDKALEGKSTINPNGGSDLVTFKPKVIAEKLNVEKYEPILLATACYTYQTVAGPSVCIDPNPYSTVKEKKVCEVQDITLSSQGAPIAIVKISEEAFAARTQFRITVKNVGNGDVMVPEVVRLDKCNPLVGAKVSREDIDKVHLSEARIGNKRLKCGPFAEPTGDTGFIRLINGEGSVICELSSSDYAKTNTPYTTPFEIILRYSYRTTAERKLQIIKEKSRVGETAGISDINQPRSSNTPSSGSQSSPSTSYEGIPTTTGETDICLFIKPDGTCQNTD